MRAYHQSTVTRLVVGSISGAVGGLAASWVMNKVQGAGEKAVELLPLEDSDGSDESSGESGMATHAEPSEPATAVAARAVAEPVLQRSLTKEEAKQAGEAVHYGYGAAMGGVYGALAETTPMIGAAAGIPYAVGLWAVGDELAVPALGLSKSPRNVPVSGHIDSFLAHVVYGVTTDVVRRIARRILI